MSATGGGEKASYYCGRNFVGVLVANLPGEIIRRHWRCILGAQLRLAGGAVWHLRERAARARLRGQLAALVGLPRTLRKRRAAQARHRVSAADLEAMLTGC